MKNLNPHTHWLGHSGICYGVDVENRNFVYGRAWLQTRFYDTFEEAEQVARAEYNKYLREEEAKRKEFNRQIAMD